VKRISTTSPRLPFCICRQLASILPWYRAGSCNIAGTVSLLWFACAPVYVRSASYVTRNLATSCPTFLSQEPNLTPTIIEFLWLVWTCIRRYQTQISTGLPSTLLWFSKASRGECWKSTQEKGKTASGHLHNHIIIIFASDSTPYGLET
jgi:hypothetical protein